MSSDGPSNNQCPPQTCYGSQPSETQRDRTSSTQRQPWHTRHTSFVCLENGQKAHNGMVDKAYVERLTPKHLTSPTPIVLIHGDFHSSSIWLTKPDGRQGWAAVFLSIGYEVVLLDIPPSGRAFCSESYNQARPAQGLRWQDIEVIEQELTAPEKCFPVFWESACRHDKWPGMGLRTDPYFANYLASLGPSVVNRRKQQTLGQDAVVSVLKWLRAPSAVLVGEGSGATMAWLAADIAPGLVAGIVAVEPDGPMSSPAAFSRDSRGQPPYPGFPKFSQSKQQYGIADIPLTFSHPFSRKTWLREGGEDCTKEAAASIDPGEAAGATGKELCGLPEKQTASGNDGTTAAAAGGYSQTASLKPNQHAPAGPVLANLAQMPHAVVSGEASFHSTSDWAVVEMLVRFGTKVHWLQLEKYGLVGNGRLLFLEKNSGNIALLIASWIRDNIPSSRPNGRASQTRDGSLHGPLATRPRHEDSVVEDKPGRDRSVTVQAAKDAKSRCQLNIESLKSINTKYQASIKDMVGARAPGGLSAGTRRVSQQQQQPTEILAPWNLFQTQNSGFSECQMVAAPDLGPSTGQIQFTDMPTMTGEFGGVQISALGQPQVSMQVDTSLPLGDFPAAATADSAFCMSMLPLLSQFQPQNHLDTMDSSFANAYSHLPFPRQSVGNGSDPSFPTTDWTGTMQASGMGTQNVVQGVAPVDDFPMAMNSSCMDWPTSADPATAEPQMELTAPLCQLPGQEPLRNPRPSLAADPADDVFGNTVLQADRARSNPNSKKMLQSLTAREPPKSPTPHAGQSTKRKRGNNTATSDAVRLV